MTDQVGTLALLFSVEETCSARLTTHLLSTATEWRTGHTVDNDAQTYTDTAISPLLPQWQAGVVIVCCTRFSTAYLIDRVRVLNQA